MADFAEDVQTLAYKNVNGLTIHLDIYPPPSDGTGATPVPGVVYFHGGALTVGNRKSWFPSWLHSRVARLGMAFISVDYQLIPPATGHDILHDIKDVFIFLERDVNRLIRERWMPSSRVGRVFQIDSHRLAVSGSSAGGLCAYLAAIHAHPRPKAVLSLYGMGGDMLTSHYLAPKFVPFFRGREILEPNDFLQYLYPACQELEPISDSPLAYHPPTYRIPGYPANLRMLLGRLYLQLGTFLDFYTGCHSPSLSATLRKQLPVAAVASSSSTSHTRILAQALRESIPDAHLHLFPQFGISPGLPPMYLIHGSVDTAVLVRESQNLAVLLRDAGVPAELVIVEGKEHSFDYEPNAEEEFGIPGGLFDRAVRFLEEVLVAPAPIPTQS
ncbi:alpha/beta-hydrolase [Cubamyces lactineus]|nr:alpha/beta-hydrolase [Cubamyces lactineus]